MVRLQLENLSVQYGAQAVLENVSAKFRGGEMVAVIGKNGVGKTTLIKAIAELLPHKGTVRVFNGEERLSSQRIAYVPQMSNSTARLTVFEMILLGLVQDLRWKVTEEHIHRVNRVMNEFDLSELAEKPFYTLSGGQKQMIFMAQSFVSGPKVLLLDEPTSALDLKHQLTVMNHAQKYTLKTGAVTVFVVHDLTLAARYADRMVLLDDAVVKREGTPEEVLHPELLEAVYDVKIRVEKNELGQYSIIPQTPTYFEATSK